MNKFLLLLLALTCSAPLVRAADVFSEGTWLLNGTVGKGPLVYRADDYSGAVPLISLSGEYCVEDDVFEAGGAFGVGVYAGYASYKIGGSGFWLNEFIVGGRGTFHFQPADRLDTYVGGILGARMPYLRYEGETMEMKESSKLAGGALLGLSYLFFENVGLNAELGLGITYFSAGIVLRWGGE